MQNQVPSVESGRSHRRNIRDGATRIAIDENELATRWGLSVKTLRRWRQESLGPVFCKLGARPSLVHTSEESGHERSDRIPH